MKKRKSLLAAVLAVSVVAAGCSTWSNTGKGAAYGAGGGAALGAGVGAMAGGGKGAGIGAAIGAAVGAGTGALIGKRMDQKQAELEKIQNAQVEQVTDQNGLQAIKVTFADGILFATGSSTLTTSSRSTLSHFAGEIKNESGFDISICGHTDNTGSRETNERISNERAKSVANHLTGQGVPAKQIISSKGFAYDQPIADNSTATGRAQNRRVEIFLTANQQMVQQASDGTLK